MAYAIFPSSHSNIIFLNCVQQPRARTGCWYPRFLVTGVPETGSWRTGTAFLSRLQLLRFGPCITIWMSCVVGAQARDARNGCCAWTWMFCWYDMEESAGEFKLKYLTSDLPGIFNTWYISMLQCCMGNYLLAPWEHRRTDVAVYTHLIL